MTLHPNTRIVTCGGSSLTGRAGLRMHEQIVELCGTRKPRALVIPTASYDEPERFDLFRKMYGNKLGCRTDVLYLLGRHPSKSELREKIGSADLIFVTGGNTLKMMRRWRRLGVDTLLRAAHRRGTVLAGSSAGALCWYAFGHSDSMYYYHPEDWEYIVVRGLGIIPATACPHVLAEGRLANFQAKMADRAGVGLGIDDDCAIAYVGNSFRVLTGKRGAKAFRVSKQGGVQRTEPIPALNDYRPVSELLG